MSSVRAFNLERTVRSTKTIIKMKLMLAVVTMVCRRKVLCRWLCRYQSRGTSRFRRAAGDPLMSGMLHEQSMVEELMFSITSSSDPSSEPSSMTPAPTSIVRRLPKVSVRDASTSSSR